MVGCPAFIRTVTTGNLWVFSGTSPPATLTALNLAPGGPMKFRHRLGVALALTAATAGVVAAQTQAQAASVPTFDHVVVAVFENHGYSQIIGSSSAPYFNSLATGGANFTNYAAITHPSQPNYFAMFSGSTQGITDDSCPPPGAPYTKANL